MNTNKSITSNSVPQQQQGTALTTPLGVVSGHGQFQQQHQQPNLLSVPQQLQQQQQVRIVPIVPGMRTRKRRSGINSSNNSAVGSVNTTTTTNSSNAGENNTISNDNMDDSIGTDNDSIRPLADYTVTHKRHTRSHKRQRRTILDAFNSISLKSGTPSISNNSSNSNNPTMKLTSPNALSGRKSISSTISNDRMNIILPGLQVNNGATVAPYNHYTHHTSDDTYQQHHHMISFQRQRQQQHDQHDPQQYNDDADSSRAVAEDNEHDNDNGYSTSSSLEDEFDDDGNIVYDDDDDEINTYGDDYDNNNMYDGPVLLSDKEELQKNVERKVMLELVFGPESKFVPPKDPVDRKLHRLIDKTLKQAAQPNKTSATVGSSGGNSEDDDIDIDNSMMDANTNNSNTAQAAVPATATLPSISNDHYSVNQSLPIEGIVCVQKPNGGSSEVLLDDVSLATTTGEYNSTVSSDSGADGNSNATANKTNLSIEDVASVHSFQTDAAVYNNHLIGRNDKKKHSRSHTQKRTIRFVFQRSNSLPDNLYSEYMNSIHHSSSNMNAATTTTTGATPQSQLLPPLIDTVAEEMDTTEHC